jgi:hypothetical protein
MPEKTDISNEDLVADYVRLMDALEKSRDYKDTLAAGLMIYGIRRIMDERGIPYPEVANAA